MKNICFQLNRKLWLSLAMLVCITLPGFAQKITVHGYVDDDLGDPLIGATVMEKGTSNGTATDIDGNFTLNVAPSATLVVSYVGYNPMEVPVDGRTNLTITMSQNTQMLAETVVIGYGSVKKSDATGSVAVITPDDIEAGISTSVQDMLVGASPGVVVTTDGGNPAGGATIRIRGGSSLSASNDPLIVIDGVPQTNQSQGSSLNAMTMLNPADIESMTILKDASATAIYGSRASNGVIIITTKKGKSPKPQVNVAANFSVNTARKTLKVMTGEQFANVVRENLGAKTIAQLGFTNYETGEWQLYNTDWQKEVLRTTFSQDYNVSVGGRAGSFPYRVNVGYTNNQGIVKGSSMDRVNVGFSLAPKFFDDKLSINANANGTYAKQNNKDGGVVDAAISFDPTKPIYSNIPIQGNTGLYLYNGYYNYLDGGLQNPNATINPVQQINDVTSWNKTLSSTGNLQIDYALHFLPELHLNLNLGYQVSKNDAQSTTAANSLQAWRNSGLTANGAQAAESLYKWHEVQRNTLLDFYINYKKEFEAIKSNLDVMLGYSWQKFSYLGHSETYVNSIGFVPGFVEYDKDGNPIPTIYDKNTGAYKMDYSTNNAIGSLVGSVSRWAAPTQLISFFGRLNYIFDDTYLLTFTLRDDGSSRFAKDKRWGLFPSVALGLKINNLGKLREVDWIDEFKLRLGWGETGQQDIGSYFPYLPIYTISTDHQFQYPGYTGNGAYGNAWMTPLYPQAYNPEITWETTTTWNVGIDFGVLNNRIVFNFDWYLRNTRDLLAWVPVKGSNTSDYMNRNIGKLRNYGLEGTITAKPVMTDSFLWTTSVNVAWNRNKITSLEGSEALPARAVPGSIDNTLQWFEEGSPAYVYKVYQQVYDAEGNPVEGQYVDQNADGVIDNKDLINYHSPEPKVTISWNNNFTWKNWDLGFTLRASLGNYVYNGPRRGNTNLTSVDQYGLHNLLANEYLFHTAPGTTGILSDYWVENASFLRCDNITLGYTWPNLCKDHLRLRLFGAVQNPFVITRYKGVDPEVFSGLDSSVYPRPVTFTLGLVATF